MWGQRAGLAMWLWGAGLAKVVERKLGLDGQRRTADIMTEDRRA
jgi:hypothetical protein